MVQAILYLYCIKTLEYADVAYDKGESEYWDAEMDLQKKSILTEGSPIEDPLMFKSTGLKNSKERREYA